METKVVVDMVLLNVLKMLLCGILLILPLAATVNAEGQILRLSMDKQTYLPGDIIEIYAEVTNANPYPVNAILEIYLTGQDIEYPPTLIPLVFLLDPGESKNTPIYTAAVDKNMPSGRYAVKVRLFFDKRDIAQDSIDFDVRGTLRELSFSLKVCKDIECMERSKVFVLNKAVYIGYDSDVSGLSITTVLKYPNGRVEKQKLPFSIKTTKIGIYELNVTASREGYKTVSVRELIGVIEKEADVPFAGICNGDGACNEGENKQNCPQDCAKAPKKAFSWALPASLIIFLLLVLAVLIYFRMKKTAML